MSYHPSPPTPPDPSSSIRGRQDARDAQGQRERPSSQRTAGRETRRLGYVDGLRALAALEVLAGHAAREVWPGVVQPGLTGLAGTLTAPFVYGHEAVSLFIVLSGFSLMLPVARNGNRLPWGTKGFYWRRARRILPPYYCALALSLALLVTIVGNGPGVSGTIALDSLPVTGRSIVEHLVLLHDFSPNHFIINPSLWSVAVECDIYLLFPVLVLCWRRYHPLFTLLVVVGLSLVLYVALLPTPLGRLPGYALTTFAPQFIGLFAMGMFAANVITAPPSPLWNRLRAWYIWEAVALVSLGAFMATRAAWPSALRDLVIGVMAIGLLLAASRPGRFNPLRAALEWRPLVWIGGFSYSVYLIHAPLLQVIWQDGLHPLKLGDLPTYLALLLLDAPLIVAASWGFWYCCERPFLNAPRSSIHTTNVKQAPGLWLSRGTGAIAVFHQLVADGAIAAVRLAHRAEAKKTAVTLRTTIQGTEETEVHGGCGRIR